jgi:hypothetical protein
MEERSGDRNDECVRLFWQVFHSQITRFDGSLDQGTQTRLVNMDLTTTQGFDYAQINVHSNNLYPIRCKSTGSGQANVTQAQNTYFIESHYNS